MSRVLITVVIPEIEDGEALKLKAQIQELVKVLKDARVQISIS